MLGIKSVKPLYQGYNALLEVTRSDDQTREVLQTKDVVVILVYNGEIDSLYFVRQFRSPVALTNSSDGYSIEIPAGHIEPGETVKETVIKECWEELRIKVTEDMVSFITPEDQPLFASPGILTERMHFVVVTIRNEHVDLSEPSRQLFGVEEEGEYIERIVFPREGLTAVIPDDLKTFALIQWFLRCMNPTIFKSKFERMQKGDPNAPSS